MMAHCSASPAPPHAWRRIRAGRWAALLLAFAAAGLRAEEPKHISVPLKVLETRPWTADGQSFELVVEDRVHGQLTLTMRLSAVDERTYSLRAEGTDYAQTWPLPAEDLASSVIAFKRKELGEPLDAAKAEKLARFCIGAGYFRFAASALGEAAGLPGERLAELHRGIVEGRARAHLDQARELTRLGAYEEAGRIVAAALAGLLEAPPTFNPASPEPPPAVESDEKLKKVERELRQFQVDISKEVQAEGAWRASVDAIRAALAGAQGADAKLIERLGGDLDGPLPGSRRQEILKELNLQGRAQANYSQALDALKAFSFAVRYGEVLSRAEVTNLDDFFAAEAALDTYFAAPGDAVDLPERLDKALSFRGLTDKAFEALVRHGARVPPPPRPEPGATEQGPYNLKAPGDELEVACRYQVYLPADYHPSSRRPLLLALHGTTGTGLDALRTWAPQAAKRGWIVAAPELVIGRGVGYKSTPEERQLALRAVADLQRRFAVDPNRVYVAGHSMGGHMTWDVALTFPDRFAAAAPFIGCVNGISANYVTNTLHVPVFCVDGEHDGEATKVNRAVFEELKKRKLPMTYKELPGRGHEAFAEEIPGVLDWLERQVRPRAPKLVDFVSADAETSQVHWLRMLDAKAAGASKDVLTALRSDGVARLSGQLSGPNAVKVSAYRVSGAKLFVSADLFDLRAPLNVTVNGGTTRSHPLEPSRKALLEFAHASGDRERLYWCAVEVPVAK
ncbi:MAG: alpha/beta fold hydrolase [Planctomycetota bacterium]|nr:alpha/beta fold hydrolase [Planctomycetota bacterium]